MKYKGEWVTAWPQNDTYILTTHVTRRHLANLINAILIPTWMISEPSKKRSGSKVKLITP